MKKLTVVSLLLLTLLFFPVASVHAGSLDDLGGNGSSEQTTEAGTSQGYTDESGLVDYMNGYQPITDENMQQAQGWSQPIVKFIGTVTSFIILITVSLMFLTTALDLLYIAFPPVRNILNPGGGAQPAGGMGAMGGMGMRGGMGMGAMGGMGAQAGAQAGGTRWISDEAIAAYQMTQPQQGAMGGMGMGMGAMGGMGAQAQPASTKSAIFTYLKKRTFFLIVYGVTTVVLFSSVIMGFGANIGVFILNIFGKLTGNL